MYAIVGQGLAGGKPVILAGDFNILPDTSLYRLLTTGQMPRDDPAYPDIPEGEAWVPGFTLPLRSALK
jgi:endonuclease/exonuclease/phosphatase family metal-dependent hydrolase